MAELTGNRAPVTEESLTAQRPVGVVREVSNANPVTDETLKALREAKAEWQKDNKGLRGDAANPPHDFHKSPVQVPRPKIERGPIQPPFPSVVTEEVTQQVGGTALKVNFALSNASTKVGDSVVHKVLVQDGKINGVFPSGMGGGNYILTPDDPSYAEIWAGLTFDIATLAPDEPFVQINSAGDSPESRCEEESGFLYWFLGFCYFDVDGLFLVQNARVGDINFSFTFGSNNGAPGLLPVDSGPGWLDMAAFFEA